MTLALIITLLPMLAGVAGFVLGQRRWLELGTALVTCAVCVLLLGLAVEGSGPLNLNESTLFGRPFAVTEENRAALQILFVAALVVISLAFRVDSGWTFVPGALVVLGLLAASLMLRPLVLSALVLAAGSAIIAIMIQAEHVGERSTLGASRFLTVNMLALPFLLAAGFYIQQSSNSVDQSTINSAHERAAMFFVPGLVLLIGALPLFSWTHPVTRDAPALVTAFISAVFSGAVMLLALQLRHQHPWLAQSAGFGMLRSMGLIAVVTGAAMGWAQTSFGRVIASALLVDAGANALLLHANTVDASAAIGLGVLARAGSLAVLGTGMAILHASREADNFARLRGAFYIGPSAQVALVAISVGGMSMAGAPGTLGFLPIWLRMRSIAPADIELAALFWLASISVAAGFLRGIASMLANSETTSEHQLVRLRRREFGVIVAACVLLIVLGIWPEPAARLAAALAASVSRP